MNENAIKAARFDWIRKQRDKHGERLFFMALSLGFCVCFIGLAFIPTIKEPGPFIGLLKSAETILIGLAMLCFNKARGDSVKEEPK